MRNIRLKESLCAHGYGRMNTTDMHIGMATTETIDRLAARAALGLPLFPDPSGTVTETTRGPRTAQPVL